MHTTEAFKSMTSVMSHKTAESWSFFEGRNWVWE